MGRLLIVGLIAGFSFVNGGPTRPSYLGCSAACAAPATAECVRGQSADQDTERAAQVFGELGWHERSSSGLVTNVRSGKIGEKIPHPYPNWFGLPLLATLLIGGWKKGWQFVLLALLLDLPTTASYDESERTYEGTIRHGGSNEDAGLAIAKGEGGYYIAGYTFSKGSGNADAWILKCNYKLELVWDKTFGGSEDDRALGIDLTTRGIMVVGYKTPTANSKPEAWALFLDYSGNLVWEKSYAAGQERSFTNVVAISADNFAVVGYGEPFTNEIQGLSYGISYLGGLLGNFTNAKGLMFNHFLGVAKGGSNIIVSGNITNPSEIAYIVEIDLAWVALWEVPATSYPSTSGKLYSVCTTTNSIFGVGTDSGKVLVVKFTGKTKNWDVRFGNMGTKYGRSVKITQTNFLVVAGYTDTGLLQSFVYSVLDSGTLQSEETYGGASLENLVALVLNSDNGFTAVGKNMAMTGQFDCYLLGGYIGCRPGNYFDGTACIACAAGEYNPKALSSSSSDCLKCPAGSIQTATGASKCDKCPESTYQPNVGMTSCLPCNPEFYPNELQSACLYKGLFTDKNSFDTSQLKAKCYSGENVIKPFSLECQTEYSSLCCDNKQLKSTVRCNRVLGLSSSDSLFDKYCGSCLFLDQTKCPPQGLCWTDSDSSSATTGFTKDCLSYIAPYCGPKLQADPYQGECVIFSSVCASPAIQSSDYGSTPTKFTVSSNQEPVVASNIFSPSFNPEMTAERLTITKMSMDIFEVDVSKMTKPPLMYMLKKDALKNTCQVSFSSTTVYTINPPPNLQETVEITAPTNLNRCLPFLIPSKVTKPYPWDGQYSWIVSYSDSVPADTLTRFSNYAVYSSLSTLNINPVDLFARMTLTIKLNVKTAFDKIVTSNILTLTPVSPNNKLFPCSPCQFYNRTLCPDLDSICWESSLISGPIYQSQDCYIAIAPSCYRVWKANGTLDQQCQDFVGSINFAKMDQQPQVKSASYTHQSTLLLSILFDPPIRTSQLLSCVSIFSEETMKWISSDGECRWKSNQLLEVSYNPYAGIMTSFSFRADAVYSEYLYAQVAANSSKISILMTNLKLNVSINAPSTASVCEPLVLSALTHNIGAVYTYKWMIKYETLGQQLGDALKADMDSFFESYASSSLTSQLAIPEKYLVQNSQLRVTVIAKSSLTNAQVNDSKMISITRTVPTISFSSRLQAVLTLRGDLSNFLTVQMHSDPCDSNATIPSSEETSFRFLLYSGTQLQSITERGSNEKEVEKILTENYKKYSAILISVSQKFQYHRYYNLTICAQLSITICDSKTFRIIKPPISCIISGAPSFVGTSSNLELTGLHSVVPESNGETLSYRWKCLSCFSYSLNTACDCPIISESSATSATFALISNTLKGYHKYTYELSISTQSGEFSRTGYTRTELITINGKVSNVTGRIIKGKANDLYFTFSVDYSGDDAHLEFHWDLLEVQSLVPEKSVFHSKLNSFVYHFFEKLGIILSKSLLSNSEEIPSYLIPTEITPNKKRILGISKAKLKSRYRYLYGVSVKSPHSLSFAFVTITTPIYPKKPQITITPTSGIGLSTLFNIQYVSDDDYSSKYLILRKDCPSSGYPVISVSPTLGPSSTYTATLAPGLAQCKYQVEIIVRIILEEESAESSQVITINPSSESSTEIIAKQLKNLNNSQTTMEQIFSTLQSVSQTEVTEKSELGEDILNQTLTYINNLDSSQTGIVALMDPVSKIRFYNGTIAILGALAKNQKANMKGETSKILQKKIISYLDDVKYNHEASYLAQQTYYSLSELTEVEEETNKDYETIAYTVQRLSEIKVADMLPAAPAFKISTNCIQISQENQYEETFNKGQTITDRVKVELPSGLAENVKQNVPELKTKKTTLTVITSVQSTSYNPYAPVVSNTQITINDLNTQSYDATVIPPEVVAEVYKDLQKGILNAGGRQKMTELSEVAFNAASIEKNSSITQYPHNISIGATKNQSQFTFPYISTIDERAKSILIPLFFEIDKQIWTNEKCSIYNATESILIATCKHLGNLTEKARRNTISIAIGVLADAINLLRSGNYRMLVSFAALTEFTLRNAIVILSCLALIIIFTTLSCVLYRRDKMCLFKARVETLIEIIEEKEHPPAEGTIQSIFRFLETIKKSSVKNVTENSTRDNENNDAGTVTRINPQQDTTNGFTKLNQKEKQDLIELYEIYEEKQKLYTEEELYFIMAEVLEENAVIQRRTQVYLDFYILFAGACQILLYEHFILSSFLAVALKIRRHIKLLLVAITLIGAIAITGYFYDPKDDAQISQETKSFVGESVVYAIATNLILLPIKIVTILFLSGYELKDDMTREEIETKEGRKHLLEKIGYIFGLSWLAFYFYSIMMFSINFEETALKKWLTGISLTILIDNIGIYSLKLVFKVFLGFILLTLTKIPCMLNIAGVITGKFLDFLLSLL